MKLILDWEEFFHFVQFNTVLSPIDKPEFSIIFRVVVGRQSQFLYDSKGVNSNLDEKN